MNSHRMRIFAIIVAAAALLGAGRDSGFLTEALRVSPLKKENKNSPVYELQKTFHEIYERYKNAVVSISTEKTVRVRYHHPFIDDPFFKEFFGAGKHAPRAQKRRGLGTGFIISSDGYICTNHHVVANMDSVTVTVNRKNYRAMLVGSDELTDIALLKIHGSDKFVPVYFGNSDSVEIGDMAIAIGNPFGLDKTITSGIISAVGRRVINDVGTSYIQTDASINPGNSGGPLINLDGEVIGVNRMIYSSTGGSLGIGFAIPINTAQDTLLQLYRYGKVKRGYIGVMIYPINEQLARELGLGKAEGALIKSVEKNGPADLAGLKAGDVITKVGGKTIAGYADLVGAVSKNEIGKTVTFTVWRGRQFINAKVTVKERP
jgi:serine protease Do